MYVNYAHNKKQWKNSIKLNKVYLKFIKMKLDTKWDMITDTELLNKLVIISKINEEIESKNS